MKIKFYKTRTIKNKIPYFTMFSVKKCYRYGETLVIK